MGTYDERVVRVSEPDDVKSFKEHVEIYKKYLNMKEPKSNRGMQSLISEEEYEA